MAGVLKRLQAISTAPSRESGDFDSWLEQRDAFAFLNDNVSDQDVVLYASLPFTFIYGVAVPLGSLEPLDVDDIMGWGANPWSSWNFSISIGEATEIELLPPMDSVGSKVLSQGEQLLFGRRFDGRQEQQSYFELSQKLAHLFDLHYVPERRSYCKLDRRGDVEEVVKIIEVVREGSRAGGTVVTLARETLDEYLALTDAAIVRLFDITRYEPKKFGGWRSRDAEARVEHGDLYYRQAIEAGYASYSRGFQIVRSSLVKGDAVRRLQGEHAEEKRYAEFIAQDWKNNVVTEISCDPQCLANYFTKSDLPFEVTPAFFRPDVLLKYKKDPDKYVLEDRSISSHNAWHLQTYDINEAGQVHTYLVYLSHLPYDEQLYWKSFNEPPKAPISKRAFTTDMKGEFFDEYDPLVSLKDLTRQLDAEGVPWWKLRSERLTQLVHYPVTRSAEEWADELMALDKLLVEGFEEKWLRKRAGELGRSPDIKARALKLMEDCLTGLGFEEDHSRQIMTPFHEVHNLRSQLKGHATGDEARKIRASTISEHGTYRRHFEALCARCDESLRNIAKAFGVALED